MARVGPAVKQRKEKAAQLTRLNILQIKGLSFEPRFDLEFEFDSHSNSNFTHLNSNRTREKPTHIFYHNLNICFINGINWWRIQGRASNLVQKLIALKFKQKFLIFRKNYTPKILGCYNGPRGHVNKQTFCFTHLWK
jgi:hypothetical protein